MRARERANKTEKERMRTERQTDIARTEKTLAQEDGETERQRKSAIAREKGSDIQTECVQRKSCRKRREGQKIRETFGNICLRERERERER